MRPPELLDKLIINGEQVGVSKKWKNLFGKDTNKSEMIFESSCVL
jgi:hypothetical protein